MYGKGLTLESLDKDRSKVKAALFRLYALYFTMERISSRSHISVSEYGLSLFVFFFLICMNEGVSQYAGSTNNPISLLSLILQLYSHLIKYLIRPSKSFHVTKLVLSGSLSMSLSFESRKDIIGSFSLISKKLILGPKKCAKVVRSF